MKFGWYSSTRGWKPTVSQLFEVTVKVTLPRTSRANQHEVFETYAKPSPQDIKDAKKFAREPDFLLVATNESKTSAAYPQKSERGKLYEMDSDMRLRFGTANRIPKADLAWLVKCFLSINADGNWPSWEFSSKRSSMEHHGFRLRLNAYGADIPTAQALWFLQKNVHTKRAEAPSYHCTERNVLSSDPTQLSKL